MKSIPVAMCWEIFHRDRWLLTAGAITALAVPTAVLGALARVGAVNADDPSMVIMQMVMVQLNCVIFGSALMSISLTTSRLYAHPASTATLVTWRLLPAMVLMAVETVAWTLALNAMFDLHWPLWGPALLAAVAISAVIAAFWIAAGSRWVILALTIVGAALGFWFKSRYGSTFGQPLHSWDEVTPAEMLTLLAMAGAAGAAAYVGLSRNRHGEAPFSLGIVACIDRLLDGGPSRNFAFSSSVAAQSWYVWRHGWLMPAGVIACSMVALVIWLFVSRDASELVTGAVVGSRLMTLIAGVGGVLFGNLGNEKDLALRQFHATRPMCSRDFARTSLRLAASSLAIAWLAWGLVASLAYGVALVMRGAPPSLIPGQFDWRELPATFLGSWVIVGGLSSILLTGRAKALTILVTSGGATWIALIVLTRLTLSPLAHAVFWNAIAVAVGVVFVLGTIQAFTSACRRELISGPTVWISVAAVASFVAGAALMFPLHANVPLAAYSLVIGLLTLTVAPIAAAPLAVVWNRHR